MEWYFWMSIGLGIAVAVLSGFVKHLSSALKETGEFLTVLGVAIEDSKITKEEASQILKEAKDAKDAWLKLAKAVMGK